jgi:phosphate starvation-inducible PhoH-like protein
LIRGKNKKQKDLLKEIGLKEITLAVGAAGVGKSYISVAKALELLAHSDNNYQKIYVITPNVEVDGSEIGFLPGDMEEKLSHYLFSTYYLMDKIIGKQNRKRLQELGIVEPLAVGFLRGVNIDNSILIAEEAQNLTKLQMKTLITRIGFNSKFIISGDLEQAETRIKDSGLRDVLEKMKDLDEIGKIVFDENDIVRNPLISKILSKY